MTPKIKASKDLRNKMWASLNRYNYIKYIRTSRYKHLSIVDRFFLPGFIQGESKGFQKPLSPSMNGTIKRGLSLAHLFLKDWELRILGKDGEKLFSSSRPAHSLLWLLCLVCLNYEWELTDSTTNT